MGRPFSLLPVLRRIRARLAAVGLPSRSEAMAGAILLGVTASPATASGTMETQVVRCGDISCLLVTGYRNDLAAIVTINGRQVPVEGGHAWRAVLPVETIREWSQPHAREIEVSLHNAEQRQITKDIVDLPIGLLGNITGLAALKISVR